MEDCSKRTVMCEFCKPMIFDRSSRSLLIALDFQAKQLWFSRMKFLISTLVRNSECPAPINVPRKNFLVAKYVSNIISLASVHIRENSIISVAKALGQRVSQTGSFMPVLWLRLWIPWPTNGDHSTHEGIARAASECRRKNHCCPEETLASLRWANEWTEEVDWATGATSERSGQDLRRPIHLETGSLPGRAKHREDFLTNVGGNLRRNDWRKHEPTRRPLCQVHRFSPVVMDTDWLSPFVYAVMDEVRTADPSRYRELMIRFLPFFSQGKIRFVIHLHLPWRVRCFTRLAILSSGDIHPTGSMWRYR